ncbi:MAG: Ig-like domain-containing protein [Bacilli bacterium]
MKFKKTIMLIVALLFTFALFGCNDQPDNTDGEDNTEDTIATSIELQQTGEVTPVTYGYIGGNITLIATVSPATATDKSVTWSTSDPTIASVIDGTVNFLKVGEVTITAKCGDVENSLEITVKAPVEISITVDSQRMNIGEELKVTIDTNSDNITWISSDESIATVGSDGVIKGIAAGQITITAKDMEANVKKSMAIIVQDPTDSKALLKLFASNANDYVRHESIRYIGWESGYTYDDNKRMDCYYGVNNYWFSELPEVTLNMLADGVKTTGEMSSVEYICVHDSAGASPSSDAAAISGWCTNSTNNGSSWQYTIGSDAIYQQMEETMGAWHCGDGAGTPMCDIDTGVKAAEGASEWPEVTISDDGYFVIEGTKSTYKAPLINGAIAKTSDIVETGIPTIIGENGNYYMHTYYNNTYKQIASFGGLNTIGIETCVNYGSDVMATWATLAKFVASKEVKFGLSAERVCFHNTLAGKPCPYTMLNAHMIDYFRGLVTMEWIIANDYSDYEITFESSNTDVLDNTGRVVGDGPAQDTTVSYTITVSSGNDTASQTFSTRIEARA